MLSSAAIAVIAFVVGWLLRRKGHMPVLTTLMGLIAGFGLSGVFGHLLATVGGWMAHFGAVGTAKLAGAAVPAIIVIGLLVWLGIELWPKTGSPNKGAFWGALILPAALAAAGGAWAQLGVTGGHAITAIGQGAVQLVTSLASGW